MRVRLKLFLSRLAQRLKRRKVYKKAAQFIADEKKSIENLADSEQTKSGTLIIKCDDLGDFMMWQQAIPFFQAHAKKPITFVGNAAAKSIVLNWFDFADHYVWIDKSKWQDKSYRLSCYQTLANLHAETAITTLFTRNVRLDDLLLYASGAKERIAWSMKHHAYYPQMKEAIGLSNREIESTHPILLEYFRNIEFFNLIYHQKEDFRVKPLFPDFKKQNRLVVFPVANAASRCWPYENFITTLKKIKVHFDQIVLIGGPNALETCNKISQGVGDDKLLNLCGETQVTDLFPLIGESALLLTVDSFALHVAVNTETPVVVVTNGTNWQRFTDYKPHVTSRVEPVYPPYFKPNPEVVKLSYSRSEIKSITVDKVIEAIQKIMA